MSAEVAAAGSESEATAIRAKYDAAEKAPADGAALRVRITRKFVLLSWKACGFAYV